MIVTRRAELGLELLLVIALVLAGGGTVSAKAAEVSFLKDVFPILAQNCFHCHGDVQKSGLDLRSRDAALKGGQRGAAIVPGNAAASRLLRRVSGHEKPSMPLGGHSQWNGNRGTPHMD